MHIDSLQYIFDPLCGWCYASAPALEYLALHHGEKLELMPSGLFSDNGSRQITPQWAEHAWTNDQRISSLTGQQFSKSYHRLLLSGAYFDSQFMNRALTAFRKIDSAAEAGLLHELQLARYVRGLDTSRSDIVAEIAIGYAGVHSLDLIGEDFTSQLDTDSELAHLTDQRIARVKQLMNLKGIRGVPLLLATINGTEHVISGRDLYTGTESITEALAKLA